MQDVGAQKFNAEWEVWKSDTAFSAQVENLVGQKYSQRKYNEKR